jgi:ribonuclease HI
VNLIYHTDGSCWPNPGPGSYAVIKNFKQYMVGTEPGDTTNNRMEGLAIIAALEDSDGQKCTIHTDSQHWKNVIEKWAKAWRLNNWTRAAGPIANLDLVEYALELYERSHATLVWVKGHNGDKGNEMADRLADKARKAFAAQDLLLIPEEVKISEYSRDEYTTT